MTPRLLLRAIIEPALSLLDKSLDTPAARAMMLAIAQQESGLSARVQILDAGKPWWQSRPGPAHGLWQFERGGAVVAVMGNTRAKAIIDPVLAQFCYPFNAAVIHDAITHNDLLAAVFARALLYSAPWPLPGEQAPDEGWRQYLWAWKPGKPHESTWARNYRIAWEAARGD